MTQTIVSYAAVIVYRLKIYTPFSSPLSIVTFLESSWWRSIATQKKIFYRSFMCHEKKRQKLLPIT